MSSKNRSFYSKYFLILKIRLKEFFQYSGLTRNSWVILLIFRNLVEFNKVTRLHRVFRSYGLAENRLILKIILPIVRKAIKNSAKDELFEVVKRDAQSAKATGLVERTVLLKSPGRDGEKGVILSTFEYNWLKMLKGIADYNDFLQNYTVIYSTSWSPTNYNILALILKSSHGTVYVQACNYNEIRKLESFDERIKCLETLPCDWLNPDYFNCKPWEERQIDLLVISNWAPFKRHWELFHALTKLPDNLKIVCVGQPEGKHTLETMTLLKDQFNVKQDIEFRESIPIEEVTELQCNSRLSAILSLREGCCVAAVEALFADSPLLMRTDAHVGPLKYITDETGFAVKPGQLAETLKIALATGGSKKARKWAEQNITCFHSVKKLNYLLENDAKSAGFPWTKDLAMPCWRPHPKIFFEEDYKTLEPGYLELYQNYPDVFGKDLGKTSCL